MTTLLDIPLVGLEDLQRAAFYVFFEGFNGVLKQVSEYWDAKDARFDQITGRNTAPTLLESIPKDNFYEGHKPSLLLSDPSGYPNLSVFATRADPGPEQAAFDQMDQWVDSLLVEVMVKASAPDPDQISGQPNRAEEIVNRRIQRTVEAVVLLLRLNQTLGGAVTGFETLPTVAISDVFAVRSGATTEGGTGPRYVWQGASINWRIRKDAVAPTSMNGIFSNVEQTDYSKYIDQG